MIGRHIKINSVFKRQGVKEVGILFYVFVSEWVSREEWNLNMLKLVDIFELELFIYEFCDDFKSPKIMY